MDRNDRDNILVALGADSDAVPVRYPGLYRHTAGSDNGRPNEENVAVILVGAKRMRQFGGETKFMNGTLKNAFVFELPVGPLVWQPKSYNQADLAAALAAPAGQPPVVRAIYGAALRELKYANATGMDLGPAYKSADAALRAGAVKRPVMPSVVAPTAQTPAPGGQG